MSDSSSMPSHSARSGSSDSIRVLIVDDNTDLAIALHHLLDGTKGMESVGHVGDADAMIDAVRSHRPDVVLLDLTMPGRDPLEALVELKAADGTLRAIVMSGYDDDATRDRASHAGADAFVSKSLDFDEIAETIRTVVPRG